jgi:hypothetical protein
MLEMGFACQCLCAKTLIHGVATSPPAGECWKRKGMPLPFYIVYLMIPNEAFLASTQQGTALRYAGVRTYRAVPACKPLLE